MKLTKVSGLAASLGGANEGTSISWLTGVMPEYDPCPTAAAAAPNKAVKAATSSFQPRTRRRCVHMVSSVSLRPRRPDGLGNKWEGQDKEPKLFCKSNQAKKLWFLIL